MCKNYYVKIISYVYYIIEKKNIFLQYHKILLCKDSFTYIGRSRLIFANVWHKNFKWFAFGNA